MSELSEWIYELDTGVRQGHGALSPSTRPNPVVYNNSTITIVSVS